MKTGDVIASGKIDPARLDRVGEAGWAIGSKLQRRRSYTSVVQVLTLGFGQGEDRGGGHQ